MLPISCNALVVHKDPVKRSYLRMKDLVVVQSFKAIAKAVDPASDFRAN
ncbi:hypothetical protein [Terriglobus roseus]|nr:hypothetical protein [Terriglobus roseus]